MFDWKQKVTMPIRDMERDGRIVFLVDVYGWTASDVCVIPGGSAPMRRAVERIGLDPNRYQATLWDAPFEKPSPVKPRRAADPVSPST